DENLRPTPLVEADESTGPRAGRFGRGQPMVLPSDLGLRGEAREMALKKAARSLEVIRKHERKADSVNTWDRGAAPCPRPYWRRGEGSCRRCRPARRARAPARW